jgi:cytochrome c oxidase cbb3-type subunit 4
MDINLVRSLITVAALAAFLGIVWWAYGPSRKARFERDARIVLDEPDAPEREGDGAAK